MADSLFFCSIFHLSPHPIYSSSQSHCLPFSTSNTLCAYHLPMGYRASLSPDLRTGDVHSSGQIPNTPMTTASGDQSPYHLSSNNGVDTQTSDQFSTDPSSFDPEAPMATFEDADDLANIQQQHAQAMLFHSQMLAQAQQRALSVNQDHGNDDVSPDDYAIQLESNLLKFQALQQQYQFEQQLQIQAQMLAQAQLQQMVQLQQQFQTTMRNMYS